MVFFLMLLKAFVAITRAVVCSWAQSPSVYTGLTTLIVVPSFTLLAVLPLVQTDVLLALVVAAMVILLTTLLVGGLGWMFEASEAIQLLASHLYAVEDLLHNFISRLNPQYGLDILDREEELTQEVDFLKEEIERAQKDGEGWRQISIDSLWMKDRADESAQKLRRVVGFVQSELAAKGEVVLANHVKAILKMEKDLHQE